MSIGRIHTTCNINGTESGRTSTGILQPPISCHKMGIALQTMTKHEDMTMTAIGGDLRSQFIADPGYTFVEPDLSQAEDRIVCVLSEDWNALAEYGRTEFKYNQHGLKDDRHTQTAMLVTGLGFEAITDWERQVGKKTRHGGNYDMKKHAHMVQLAGAGIFISEYTANKQLERFHDANPAIKGIFHASIQQALQDNDCLLRSPHGRERTFYNKWGDELFKEGYSFIPQASVSDQVKFAMVRIRRRINNINLRFCLESHDSFLALVKDEILEATLPIIKEELERPISFRNCTLSRDYDLVIPAEFNTGKRWIKQSKEYPDGMSKADVKL